MRTTGLIVAGAAALLLPCASVVAASVTVAALADSDDGFSYDADASFSMTESWSVGAGAGKLESKVSGTDFAGTSLRASTNLIIGAFNAGASLQRWKDSNDLKSTTLRAQLGWMAESGLSLSALFDDRDMAVDYTTTVLGVPQESQIDFDGRGFGADVSWFGTEWTLGARFIAYDYGRSVQRVRAAISSSSTQRFPRIGSLLDSIVTRASGAPDRQMGVTLGRSFSRTSLQGDLGVQRDALTREKVSSLTLTHGYRFAGNFRLDTTVGFSDSDASDTVAFGGLALTWRAGATPE